MKRKYNAEQAREKLSYLKSKIKNLMLSADIIVGFPGESDEDFDETYNFLKEIEFLHLHIFPYSKREGTVAATMSGQVNECIKKERLHKLSQQQSDIRREILNSIVDSGKSLEVLCESFDGEFNVGHTDNFLEVRIPSNKKINNEFVRVKPFATDGDYIYADIIE